MTEETYLKLVERYGEDNFETYERMKKAREYEIAKAELSAGIPADIIAKTFQFTPGEMKKLKKEVRRASRETT